MAQSVHHIAVATLAGVGGVVALAASSVAVGSGSALTLAVAGCVGAAGLAAWTAHVPTQRSVRQAVPVRAKARASRHGRLFE